MTPAEKKLWNALLRGNQLDGGGFRRQHAIGQHIADFCSPKYKLVIELDGSPHAAQQEADAARTYDLGKLGYRVLRFWNWQVLKDIAGVLEGIQLALKERT